MMVGRARLKVSALVGVLGMLFVVSAAQAAMELPRLSPHARVMQRVGITDITVDYYSPGVKGRTIWGKLLPYGKLWRAGANRSTQITFSTDVTFGSTKVKAGTYSVFSVPGKASFQVMLNSKYPQWGTRGYKTKFTVATAKAKVQAASHRERLTFLFANTTDLGTKLHMEWGKVRVAVSIKVDTKVHALANIKKTLARPWRNSFLAARYLLRAGDTKLAEKYIDHSIKLESNWWNQWVKASILAKKGQRADALKHAQLAAKLGAKDRIYNGFYKKRILLAITQWSPKKEKKAAPKKTKPSAKKGSK